MNRGLIYLIVISLLAVVVYLGIANRQLQQRLAQLDAAQPVRQTAPSSDEQEAVPIRRIPRRQVEWEPVPARRVQMPKEPPPQTGSEPDLANPADETQSPVNPDSPASVSASEAAALVIARPAIWPVAVPADDWTRYYARDGSRCLVEGTSNIHDWQLQSTVISGQILVPPGVDLSEAGTFKDYTTNVPCSVAASVPVRFLRNEQRAMNTLMLEAMDASHYRSVEYRLKGLFFQGASTNEPAGLSFQTVGDLSIHGVTNQVEMPITIAPQPDGRLSVIGSARVKMTDFGIVPPKPSLAMGIVRTGDEVKITFQWKLERIPHR